MGEFPLTQRIKKAGRASTRSRARPQSHPDFSVANSIVLIRCILRWIGVIRDELCLESGLFAVRILRWRYAIRASGGDYRPKLLTMELARHLRVS
jgi:hypothetical protein